MSHHQLEKWFWRSMLILAGILLILGFLSGNLMMWIMALTIGILVRYCAYDLLFADFDAKADEIRQHYLKKKEAK
ncbi:hypothetical protein QH637_03110 [Heyndrickxia coagulans]